MDNTTLNTDTKPHELWIETYRNSEFEIFDEPAFDFCATQMPLDFGDTVLDAGCGSAHKSIKLAHRGYQVTGVDFSDYAVATGLEQIPPDLKSKIALQTGDLTQLRFDSNQFDHVLCWGVLMHIPSIEKAVSELVRVLRPGGTLLISEMNCWAPENRIDRWLRNRFKLGSSTIKKSRFGFEAWTIRGDDKLLTRCLDPKAFVEWMITSQGTELRQLRTCEFTQLYGRVPWAAPRAFLHHLNRLSLRYNFLPGAAASNILVFSKVV